MNQLAPIIVFCYNRPEHVKQTLLSLSKNELADQSVLYIYCDGPRNNTTDEQINKITKVRQIVREQKWCKEVHIYEAEKNKGLAKSIVGGVSEIINYYGKVIVLEDDIVTSVGFLRYMNDALDIYMHEEKVMHISAYMYPHKNKLPETFFYQVPYPGGGWATWQRAWKFYNDNTDELYQFWSSNWRRFNKFGGTYLQKQLEENKNGTISTWFIKWHAVLLQHNALTLYPHWSLTNNIGFDDSGTNCSKMTKFDIVNPSEYVNVVPVPVIENKKVSRIIYHFYQGYWYSKRNRIKWIEKIKKLFK